MNGRNTCWTFRTCWVSMMSNCVCLKNGRRSFSQQDAPVTAGEKRVQLPARRSISVKDIEVRPVAPAVVAEMMNTRHYLKSMPRAPVRCYGVYAADDLLGGAVFTAGGRNCYRVLTGAKPSDVITLARLWLDDRLPQHSETRVIGIILRDLKRSRRWKAVISFADPVVGHTGTIYRASNWLYAGRTDANGGILVDGQLVHSRTMGERYGSASIGHLRRTGIDAVRLPGKPKRRFVFLLDKCWRWRLRCKPQPFSSMESDDGS